MALILGLTVKLFNVDSTINRAERYVDADEAARLLGVRKQTLYAYVSRGLVKSHGAARSKGSRYAVAELARLKARSEARSGHTAVAAGALRWGEPVLDSSITEITPRGPAYRGHPAVDLAARGISFEAAAELLWSGELPAEPPRWRAPRDATAHGAVRASLLGSDDAFVRLASALVVSAEHDERRFDSSPATEMDRARALLSFLAGALAGRKTRREMAFADRVALAIGLTPTPRTRAALDQMLVLLADHELNASSFAARVAAGTGADLQACLAAALATASGPLHGAAALRVEALVDAVGSPARARAEIEARARRGESVPGFAHPLYPDGDPRAAPLLDLARALAPRSLRVRTLQAVCAVMARARNERANVDLALVAACDALGATRGAASKVFVLGRTAGWVAHVMEQRTLGFILRPRARYRAAAR